MVGENIYNHAGEGDTQQTPKSEPKGYKFDLIMTKIMDICNTPKCKKGNLIN